MCGKSQPTEDSVFVKPFRACTESGWIYDGNDVHVLDVRAWGYLTGTGGLGFRSDVAAKIQDDFQQRVVDALNAYDNIRFD